MKRSVLICVVFFVLGVAVGRLLGVIPQTAPLAEAAVPGVEDGSTSAILEALARIERRLDALELEPVQRPAVVQRADAPVRAAQPDGAPMTREELAALSGVVPAIDELRAALEAHLAEDRELAGRGLGKLKEQYPDVNWPALRKLIHAWNLDEEETRRDVLLLGYREILERYGAPTTSWGGEQGIDWLYYDAMDPVTGETSTEVWIHFADGLVTDMGIKQP